jgi:glycosyltransferase 2 family protein
MREQALGADDTADAADDPLIHPRTPTWRRLLGRGIAIALALGVGWLVVDRARKVDWQAVWQVLLGYPVTTLLAAVAFASAAHLTYATYDLLARRYLDHRIAPLKVVGVGLVSYAFNLNLGALVGGFAFRWRLYSRLGLTPMEAGRVFMLSLLTNWSGYMVLAGVLLATRSFEPPAQLGLDAELAQLAGIVMLAASLLYVLWCATAQRRVLHWRGRAFDLPTGRLALEQVALSVLHWALTGAVIWTLMPGHVPYGTVFGTLLCAAVAGVVLHVPGGLGVIEAVFIATLGDRVPEGQLIAALLGYRAAFYLLPLAGATALHFGLEAMTRRQRLGR